jgi:threonine/homoserine/homoserine lactone efflux protein
MMVMAQALQGGLRRGLKAVAGIQAGHLFFFFLLWAGLGLSGSFFNQTLYWLQHLGSAYLIVVGIQLLAEGMKSKADLPRTVPDPGGAKPFAHAFLTHVSNPKALLFTFALVPAYLDSSKPLFFQLALLMGLMILGDIAVMSSYALLAAQGGHLIQKRMKILKILAGMLITYVGVDILFSLK